MKIHLLAAALIFTGPLFAIAAEKDPFTVSPKDDAGNIDTTRKILVFVKCDVIPVK